jgi:hypothetical protein
MKDVTLVHNGIYVNTIKLFNDGTYKTFANTGFFVPVAIHPDDGLGM